MMQQRNPQFSPQSDPLGVGLQNRARQHRFELAAAGLESPIGPLPDPQWDAYFQAIGEAANGKPVRYAQDSNEIPDPTFDPGYRDQNQDLMPLALPKNFVARMRSTQLGVRK